MLLETAIENFLDVHQRFGLKGQYLASSQPWPIELPSSSELDFFYKSYDPQGTKIETGFTPVRFHALVELMQGQVGYRWRAPGQSRDRIDSWPEQYLVIADDFGGGKPIIADTSSSGTRILAKYDVAKPFPIADSLAQFFEALTGLVTVVYGHFNVFDIVDENEEIKYDFLQNLEATVSPIIGDANYSGFADYFYG
ncbi:MAG: hypothetical protein E6R14_06495 [Thermomicrobiales bacterium]|nr:MAG: hypothetical protein E6R14_06495 [Thermomicrobiales bacterium]